MTARAEYTDEEWALLYTAPIIIGVAVAYAEPGAAAREVITAALMQGTAAKRYPGNELLGSLWSVRPGAAAEATPVQPVPLPSSAGEAASLPRELLDRALETARKVVALLDDRSGPLESEGVRSFLGDVAVATAEAARSGGFLGLGGVRVTPAERAAVDAIREALGLEPMPAKAEDAQAPPAPDTVQGAPSVPSGPINPS